MTKSKDLQYFLKLNYTVILKKKGDVHYAFIPELSLIAEGKSAGDVYKNIENEKEAYFKKMFEAGHGDLISEPLGLKARNRLLEELGMYFAKTFIGVFIITAFILASLPFVNDVLITSRLNRIPSKIKLEMELFVEKWESMSPAEKEKIKERIKRVAQEIKPFINEFKSSEEDKPARTH